MGRKVPLYAWTQPILHNEKVHDIKSPMVYLCAIVRLYDCSVRTLFDRFYIGCDRCDDWYHGSCVGVTKSEADRMDTYVCPVCRQKESVVTGDDADAASMPLQVRHWLELRRIVNSLQVNSNSQQYFYCRFLCTQHAILDCHLWQARNWPDQLGNNAVIN